MSNAIRFTPEGGAVRISALRHRIACRARRFGYRGSVSRRRFCRTCSSDSGRAMPRATRTHGGLGLGLAIGAILLNCTGSAAAVSAGEGKGATFIVRLPTA